MATASAATARAIVTLTMLGWRARWRLAFGTATTTANVSPASAIVAPGSRGKTAQSSRALRTVRAAARVADPVSSRRASATRDGAGRTAACGCAESHARAMGCATTAHASASPGTRVWTAHWQRALRRAPATETVSLLGTWSSACAVRGTEVTTAVCGCAIPGTTQATAATATGGASMVCVFVKTGGAGHTASQGAQAKGGSAMATASASKECACAVPGGRAMPVK